MMKLDTFLYFIFYYQLFVILSLVSVPFSLSLSLSLSKHCQWVLFCSCHKAIGTQEQLGGSVANWKPWTKKKLCNTWHHFILRRAKNNVLSFFLSFWEKNLNKLGAINITLFLSLFCLFCSFTCYTHPHTLPATRWDILLPPSLTKWDILLPLLPTAKWDILPPFSSNQWDILWHRCFFFRSNTVLYVRFFCILKFKQKKNNYLILVLFGSGGNFLPNPWLHKKDSCKLFEKECTKSVRISQKLQEEILEKEDYRDEMNKKLKNIILNQARLRQ